MEFFTSNDFWEIVVKVLVTASLSTIVGLAGTLIGKTVSKHKESKIYKYAKTCVAAAEMKYPNQGKKMGPEKMAYVMDQLAIKFPKIKESTYFYNIAEAAVLELNKDIEKEQAIKDFEEKYGEKPLAVLENETEEVMVQEEEIVVEEQPKVEEKVVEEEQPKVATPTQPTTPPRRNKLSSF